MLPGPVHRRSSRNILWAAAPGGCSAPLVSWPRECPSEEGASTHPSNAREASLLLETAGVGLGHMKTPSPIQQVLLAVLRPDRASSFGVGQRG